MPYASPVGIKEQTVEVLIARGELRKINALIKRC
jgi:hypothetical protein